MERRDEKSEMRERVDADRHPSSRQQAVSTMEVCAIFPRLSLDKINKTMPKLPAATTDVNTQVMVQRICVDERKRALAMWSDTFSKGVCSGCGEEGVGNCACRCRRPPHSVVIEFARVFHKLQKFTDLFSHILM